MAVPVFPSPPPPLGGAPKGRQGLVIAAAIAVIALAAGAGVVIARSTKDDTATSASSVVDSSAAESSGELGDNSPPRANTDHFHAAYSVNICGVEQRPLDDVKSDAHGIHTHGDGLIHIHPFDQTVAGNRATLAAFFDQTGVQLTDSTLTIEGSGTKTEGRDQCNGRDAELVVLVWASAEDADAGRSPDETHTTDMGAVRLRRDAAITIAFRAEGASVSGPSDAVDRLTTVGDIAPSTTRGRTTTSTITTTTTRPTSTSTA